MTGRFDRVKTTVRLGLRLVCLATLAGIASCKTGETKHPTSTAPGSNAPDSKALHADKASDAGASPALAPAKLSQLEQVTAWLDALRRRDVPSLVARTRYPFTLRDAGTEGHCAERQSAAEAANMPATIQCLTTDDVLEQLLKTGTTAPVEMRTDGYLPPWAEPWRAELRPDWRPLSASFWRDDASFTLVFLVAADGVRGVWKHGFDATAEVKLATQWLEALRHRDVPALTQLTSYPFELRDTELEAHCGARVAAKAHDLPVTIACLLKDKLFMEAIREESPVRAGLERDFVPGFFEGWRRPEHADLWPTMVLVGTEAGNEFDLTLLVAKTGVRAVWKRGSFSPPD